MLLSHSDWQSIQARAGLPAFAAARQRLQREVDDFLARPVAVPTAPGGYYHDYFCPDHGVQLDFAPEAPHAHRCPVDGAVWTGERFDAAWRWFVNNRLAESALRLALRWRLEGDPAHLAPVQQTLIDYAAHYAGYKTVARTVANPGVATYTTLDESVWVLPLAWAFDLVRAQLSEAEQATIAQDLLAPVAAHLVEYHFQGIHNFACWHNAAIGTIGVVIEREDLVAFAMESDFGCYNQLQRGVLADGLWFEGSFSYHFYTLYALLTHAKAMRHHPGYDLRQRPELHAMLLAPIESAFPDWSLPAPNDCWYFISLLNDCCHGVPPGPAFYEIGYQWYHEPRFGQILQRAYQQAPRDTLDALLFGAAELPTTPPVALPSTHLPASGYAILRTPPPTPHTETEQTYLLLKYGPHGGGHGHPDKLNLIVHAYGERLSADLGTPGYGVDLFESWYRQTSCHNTITLAGQSQPEATGTLHRFHRDGAVQIADAAVHWAENAGVYTGATVRRIVLARPTYFLDLVLVQTPEPQRIDWLYHNRGDFHSTMPLAPYPALATEGEGYQHLRQAQRLTVDTAFTAAWQFNGVGLHLFSAGAPATTVITATTPGNPPSDERVLLLQRQQGTAAAFFTLWQPFRATPLMPTAAPTVTWLGQGWQKEGWAGCQVTIGAQQEYWLIQHEANQALPAWFHAVAGATRFCYALDGGPIAL
ncbi:MAG: heparinase II/III family protein [Caldilineaceae bacterium]|nr:heparinase II/III family protein [Caldilineaceae bacterium]